MTSKPPRPSQPAGSDDRAKDGPSARMVTVSEDREGQRIDNFLLSQLKGAPKSLIYKIVRSGQVRVNGGRVKVERKLNAGDQVRIPPVRLSEAGESTPPPTAFLEVLEKAIVFEDDRLLALNKPSGLASHGGSGIKHGAIESLRALRPGQSLELVHRLDRDTSGLLIVAKKRSALRELQALLREDHGAGITKTYLALLQGRLPNGELTVQAPLHVGLRQGGERHVTVHPQGKVAISHFKVVERLAGQTLAAVRIETGRTHQIRVHAQHLNHPILGDDKYGDEEANKRIRKDIGLKRLFLHAARLAFSLGEGDARRDYKLEAPLPEDLNEVLGKMRG